MPKIKHCSESINLKFYIVVQSNKYSNCVAMPSALSQILTEYINFQ